MIQQNANKEAVWVWRQEADDTPEGVETRIARLALEYLQGKVSGAQAAIDAAQEKADYFDKFGPDAPATLADSIPNQLEAARASLARAHHLYEAELIRYHDALDGRTPQTDVDQYAQLRLAELDTAESSEAS